MDFEKEFMPGSPVEDKVFILRGDKAEELIVSDDDGENFDEEDEAPNVEYD